MIIGVSKWVLGAQDAMDMVEDGNEDSVYKEAKAAMTEA